VPSSKRRRQGIADCPLDMPDICSERLCMGESVDVTGGYAERDAVFDEMGLGKWLLISVLKYGGDVVSVYMPGCMVRAVL